MPKGCLQGGKEKSGLFLCDAVGNLFAFVSLN